MSPSSQFPPTLQRQRLFDFFHQELLLSIIEIHTSEMMQYVLFVWLFSYSKIFWRFHIIVIIIVPFYY